MDLISGTLNLNCSGTISGTGSFTGAAGTSLGLDGPWTTGAQTSLSGDDFFFGSNITIGGNYHALSETDIGAGTTDFTGASVTLGNEFVVGLAGHVDLDSSQGTVTTTTAVLSDSIAGSDSLVVIGQLTVLTFLSDPNPGQNSVPITAGTALIDGELAGDSVLTVSGLTTFTTNGEMATGGTINAEGGLTIAGDAPLWRHPEQFRGGDGHRDGQHHRL